MFGHCAVKAGACAAAASVFGKLAGLPTLEGLFVLKILCLVLMAVCNAAVWTYFAKALQSSESSLSATVISASTNYIISAVVGILMFGEITSFLWWSGTLFILGGLVLVTTGECRSNDPLSEKNN